MVCEIGSSRAQSVRGVDAGARAATATATASGVPTDVVGADGGPL